MNCSCIVHIVFFTLVAVGFTIIFFKIKKMFELIQFLDDKYRNTALDVTQKINIIESKIKRK